MNSPIDSAGRTLSLTSLALADAARVLAAAGWREVTVELLQRDVAAGAPTNGDGTLNLIAYTAWLIRELEHVGN